MPDPARAVCGFADRRSRQGRALALRRTGKRSPVRLPGRARERHSGATQSITVPDRAQVVATTAQAGWPRGTHALRPLQSNL